METRGNAAKSSSSPQGPGASTVSTLAWKGGPSYLNPPKVGKIMAQNQEKAIILRSLGVQVVTAGSMSICHAATWTPSLKEWRWTATVHPQP